MWRLLVCYHGLGKWTSRNSNVMKHALKHMSGCVRINGRASLWTSIRAVDELPRSCSFGSQIVASMKTNMNVLHRAMLGDGTAPAGLERPLVRDGLDAPRSRVCFPNQVSCATFSLSASLGLFERGLRKKTRKKADRRRWRERDITLAVRQNDVPLAKSNTWKTWMRANRQQPLDMNYLIHHQVYRFTHHIFRFTSLPALNSWNSQHSLSLFHFNNMVLLPDTSLAARKRAIISVVEQMETFVAS